MKKALLALILAVVMVAGVILFTSSSVSADDSITLKYDDRKDLSELLSKTVTDVSISNQNTTSNQVGSNTKDENVLIYEDGILYAVGTGTATLTVDGTAYQVTVEPAPISLFMITGHSVGAGQYGTASQSVAVEAGQAYSSYYYKSLDTTKVDGYGLGYGSANRAGNADSNQYDSTGILDAFAPGNGGTTSTGSALAYQWNKLTGEKIWVLNAAVPGSCINEWQEGHSGHHTSGAYAYNYYDKAVEMYQCAQAILKNEIAAGHYSLSHMGIIYFNGANFSNASYTDWTLDSLKGHYEGMWNGFKTAFTTDMDGDGDTETVEALGIVPFWSLSSLNYSVDKATTYYMAASQEWPDVFTLSDIYHDWMTLDGINNSFPAIDYATNSGEAVQVPASVKNSAQGGSSTWSVFCANDNTHLSQVAYNAVGFDMGNNLYQYFCQDVTATSGHFEDVSRNALDSVIMTAGEQKSIVPVMEPLYGKKVTLAATGAVSLNGNCVVANEVGSGTVTMSIDGAVVDTITVTVAEHMDHCACGGHANGMKNHTCSTLTYKAWGNTDAEKTSLPTTAGNYYLVSDITISSAPTVSVDINLCLNGHDINASARINQKANISITDCNDKADWGTFKSTKSDKNLGGLFYIYEDSRKLNLYAGIFDASETAVYRGGIAHIGNAANSAATVNVYGGTYYGANLVNKTDSTTPSRGGLFIVTTAGTLNIYGGELTGGSCEENGGGIYVNSNTTFNMYGGTISGGSSPSNGGCVYVAGTFNMEGGTISGGSAKQGGNVYNAKTMKVSGGTISGGEASAYGGNICVASTGTTTYTGGTVSGGKAASGGGNICALPGATVIIGQASGKTTKITDGIVGDGTTGNGGNIYCGSNSSSDSNVTISGGTVSGGKAKIGGNIFAQSIVTVSGGTVKSGIASESGGNVFASGTFTVTGGTLSGGTAVNGGNIYSKSNTTISGGTISGGQASSCGGNIYQLNVADVTLKIIGGTISGGKTTATASTNLGGNIYIHGESDAEVGNMVMEGGTITGGVANCGGNIYTNGTVTITDGTITAGQVKGSNACGGNIYVGMVRDTTTTITYPSVTMSGGTISDGKASSTGGNIQCHGTFTMTGGLISGGTAASAGSIRVFRPGTFVLDGGTIEGGTATNKGGVFQVVGRTATTNYSQVATLTIKSGTITGGCATNGGTISVEYFGVLNIEGGTINGGTASECGGAIYVGSANDDCPAVVNISGGEIVNGTAVTGNGIYITDVKGGGVTVTADAKFSGEGVNLYVDNAAQTNVVFNQLSGADTLIVVDAADKNAAFATADGDYSGYMICGDSDYLVSYAEGTLSFAKDTTAKVAAVYEGENELAKYATLEDAIAAAGDGYVKLLADIETDYVLTGTVWIDLNGFDLTGITVSGTLYGMDSTTGEYSDANVGVLTATVAEGGSIVSHCMTTAERYGAIHRYMTVSGENNTYTFHRFYLSVTQMSLKPGTYGIGYKAEFYGDDTVKAQLGASNAFGYQMWIAENNKIIRAYGADQFGEKTTVTLRINNFLDPAKDDGFNEERANIPVNANVFITLTSGEIIETDPVAYTFKEMTELAANNYENYNADQQAALDTLGTEFEGLMFRWAVPFIHHAADGWTGTTTIPATSGKYYLTEDISSTATVKIAPDQEVTLCLNGHTIQGSARIYYVSGTLNICDCCHKKAETEQGYMIGNGTSLAPVLYTYYGSTVNLYSGNLTATQQVSQAGVIALGNDDGKYTSENPHSTIFNMYGGKIYGGKVTGKGGNIASYHGGIFNMYGGEISGGTAGTEGGNIVIAASSSDTDNMVLNIYGGVINDGTAGTSGGNIYGGTNSEVHIYGGTVADGTALANGGNIAMTTDNLTMEGGTVSGGKASAGGNIYVPAADSTNLVLDGGTITGGQAETHGGNLYLVNKGTYTFNNMTISDGYAVGDGGNIYMFTDMDEANYTEEEFDVVLHNCTITGGKADDEGDSVYVMEADLTISGSTVIQNAGGESLYLGAGEKVVLKDLTSDAKIYVSMSVPGTMCDDAKYLSHVYADDTSMDVENVNGIKLIDQATSANVPELTGFSVGWYRGDITPGEAMPLDGMGNNEARMEKWEIKTALEAGVTVIADETGIENAIVLVSVDTLFIQKELSDNLCQVISDATGIAKNRIFFSASHTHSGVDHDAIYEQTRNYLEDFYVNMTSYVVNAVEDLAPATIQTASIDLISTDGNSLNLSRRYIGDDGNAYSSIDSSKSYAAPEGAERESASDPQMQLIRFVREGKTDVVMSNWQAHPTGWASATYGRVSAENWKYFRESVESQLSDTVCTFFLGAAGNLGNAPSDIRASFQSIDGNTYAAYVSGSTQSTLEGMGNLMASYAVYALNNSTTNVASGALKVANHTFETESYYFTGTDTYKADMSKYKAIDMDLNAITIGDSIGFITAPYEMFHENGQQIKAYAESLGINTCFVLTNSMGENKYIGSDNAFENDSTDGAYSSFGVRTCRFVQGTAEALIDQYAKMLAGLKGQSVETIYKTITVNVVDDSGNAVQNVMVELIGNGNTRNCSDADGSIIYYVYQGGTYSVNVVKVPAGYTYEGGVVSFVDGVATVTVTAAE